MTVKNLQTSICCIEREMGHNLDTMKVGLLVGGGGTSHALTDGIFLTRLVVSFCDGGRRTASVTWLRGFI